jgi:hypothetical protein
MSLSIWHQNPHPWPDRARRIGFVSGLSDPTSSALTRDQIALLRSLPFDESEIICRNFPFTSDVRETARDVSMIWASLMNGWQYMNLGSPRVRKILQSHWTNLLHHTGRLYLVSLSCGLECIRVGIESSSDASRVHVVALGPVCRQLPNCSLTIIQGEQDWISRSFVPDANHLIPGLGHMGYLGHSKTQEILCSDLVNNISE